MIVSDGTSALLNLARSIAEDNNWCVGETDTGLVCVAITPRKGDKSYVVSLSVDEDNEVLYALCKVPVAPITRATATKVLLEHINTRLPVGKFVLFEEEREGILLVFQCDRLIDEGEEFTRTLIEKMVYGSAACVSDHVSVFNQVDKGMNIDELKRLASFAVTEAAEGVH